MKVWRVIVGSIRVDRSHQATVAELERLNSLHGILHGTRTELPRARGPAPGAIPRARGPAPGAGGAGSDTPGAGSDTPGAGPGAGSDTPGAGPGAGSDTPGADPAAPRDAPVRGGPGAPGSRRRSAGPIQPAATAPRRASGSGRWTSTGRMYAAIMSRVPLTPSSVNR